VFIFGRKMPLLARRSGKFRYFESELHGIVIRLGKSPSDSEIKNSNHIIDNADNGYSVIHLVT
jgi:hypothetical protein